MYGAFDVRLFPNKRLNVDLKNIEIRVSHGLNKSGALRFPWIESFYVSHVSRTVAQQIYFREGCTAEDFTTVLIEFHFTRL